MTTRKRKKNSRQRGTTTHGWGSMKKHRGAGSRGGRGHAGTGKRADCKKPTYWTDDRMGKQGFKSKSTAVKRKPINLKDLDEHVVQWVAQGKFKESGGVYEGNLKDVGFNKLLATGTLRKKFNLTVDFASARAVARIQHAGGTIVVKNMDVETASQAVEEAAEGEAA